MALLISITRRSACRCCSGRCRRDRREVGRPRLTVARLFVDRDDRFRADLEIRPAPYDSGLVFPTVWLDAFSQEYRSKNIPVRSSRAEAKQAPARQAIAV